MTAILKTMYCIPCIWTVLCLLATFGVMSWIRNSWVPFRGPLPSDGPVEGFASKAARIEFFDTLPLRVRTSFKAGVFGVITWIVVTGIALLVLQQVGG